MCCGLMPLGEIYRALQSLFCATLQAKHWTVYVYAGKDRLAITAEKLAAFDIVLATPETMLMDSPLKTQKALHQ